MVEISAKKRVKDEKPKRLRRRGQLPAILYGPERDSLSLKLNKKEFIELTKRITRSTQLNLVLDGEEQHAVFLRDIQYDHLRDEPIHVDFYEVPQDRVIEIKVPVRTIGVAEGVQSGGILDHLMETIEVEGRPSDIPEIIELNVEELEIGDSIHISDLDLENVDVLDRPDSTILSVLSPRKEIEIELEPAEAPLLAEGEAEEELEEAEEELEEEAFEQEEQQEEITEEES